MLRMITKEGLIPMTSVLGKTLNKVLQDKGMRPEFYADDVEVIISETFIDELFPKIQEEANDK